MEPGSDVSSVSQNLENVTLDHHSKVKRKPKKAHAFHTDLFQQRGTDNDLQNEHFTRDMLDQRLGTNEIDNGSSYRSAWNNSPSKAPDKLDAIPSLVKDREYVQDSLGDNPIFRTFENACPPPACTDYKVQDQGLSGPEFLRLTMYNIPTTDELRSNMKLPLGLLVRPFAPKLSEGIEGDDYDITMTDFSTSEPPRCRRCRTYINPSMLFVQGGTKFICNMCQFSNYVPADYFQPTDASNRRIDWQDRPELAYGTYDIAVSPEYWKDNLEPSPLCHLFLIDVTMDSVKKDLPKLAVEAIRTALYNERSSADNCSQLQLPPGTKVGIATFDHEIHFFNLKAGFEQPQMISMPDINEPFVPLEVGLFVDPEESRPAIEQLLDRLDILFAETVTSEPAYGATLEVAYQAMKATGGRVSVILSSLPTWGPGSLFLREAIQKEDAKEQFIANSNYYIDMGKKYCQAGIGLDLFLFPTAYIDVANSGEVCRQSGGRTFYYPRFVPQRDGRKFISEFCSSCCQQVGTQAILKVRCSNGLQVQAYYGNFYHEEWADDPFLGIVTSDTVIGVLFNYDGKLDTKLDVHFQSALLYTSSTGQRMVRVNNLLASVTEQYKPAMNFVDIDACTGLIARDSLSKIGKAKMPLKNIRSSIHERIVEVFANYRKLAGSNLPPSQLLMPISLRSFIIYGLALQKSRPLRDIQVIADARVYALRLVNSMTADELALYLYPRIIGLHNLRDNDCTYKQDGSFTMPVNIRASFSCMEDGGVYLVFNGQSLLLWLHKYTSPDLLRELFGDRIKTLTDLDPYVNELPVLDTNISKKARALVNYFMKKSRQTFLVLQLARQGIDGAEYEFTSMMVEDGNLGHYNYQDYVTHVHRNVKLYLETKGSKSNLLSEAIALSPAAI